MLIQILLVASIICFIFSSGCTSKPEPVDPFAEGEEYCQQLRRTVNWDDAIGSLNNISKFYEKDCYRDVIDQVGIARSKLTDKTYSISKEALEFLIPAGKVTDYVLESYERGYLGFLAAASYLKSNQLSSLPPELNKIYNEETALTYNHGRDAVNALVQAAMWDNVSQPGFSSRPFWLWLKKQKNIDPIAIKFAKDQLKRIDAKSKAKLPSSSWRIYGLGRFPDLDWEMKLINADHGYFKISPKQPFPQTCANDGALMLPTTTWFNKISIRHAHSYHPLVNLKSWVRLPIGLFLGLTTYTTGATIAVGGCVATFQAGADGRLCELSLKGGKAVMDLSPNITSYILEPDLRHWQALPMALLIVPGGNADIKKHKCLENYSDQIVKQII